jgi:hypothetical protein
MILCVAVHYGSTYLVHRLSNANRDKTVNQLHSSEAVSVASHSAQQKGMLEIATVVVQGVLVVGFLFPEVRRMKNFTRTSTAAVIGLLLLSTTGCWRPYHEPVWVRLETNEIPFLINEVTQPAATGSQDSVTDDERLAFLESQLIDARRIVIEHEWKQTGYMSWVGRWEPSQKLVIVDTSPVTRKWVADINRGTSDHDDAIWAESRDSVGFSTGIVITARIESQHDAVVFLHNYPPRSFKKIEHNNGEFNSQVTKLSDILDTEIQARIQKVFADEAGSYDMNECRAMKLDIMKAVETDVVPFFKERGIAITTIGMFGGFTYENPDNQKAIDAVFGAEQEEHVAEARIKAAEKQKEALRLEGEGQAAQALEVARGKAETEKLIAEAKANAIQQMADARAYEIEKFSANPEAYLTLKKIEVEVERLKSWDGKYPQTLFGEMPGEGFNLMVDMPSGANK